MKEKILKSIVTVILALILSFTLGLSFYSYNARVVNHDLHPMPFGIGMAVVYSGSMEPEFSVGDLVVTAKADEYALRDIIVYQGKNKAVMHRIVGIDGDSVTTQGDANNVPDEPIERSSIKGKVLFSVPLLGYVVSFLQSVPGIIIVLGLSFFLFEYSFIREKREERKKLAQIRQEIERLKQEQESE